MQNHAAASVLAGWQVGGRRTINYTQIDGIANANPDRRQRRSRRFRPARTCGDPQPPSPPSLPQPRVLGLRQLCRISRSSLRSRPPLRPWHREPAPDPPLLPPQCFLHGQPQGPLKLHGRSSHVCVDNLLCLPTAPGMIRQATLPPHPLCPEAAVFSPCCGQTHSYSHPRACAKAAMPACTARGTLPCGM